MNNDYREAIKTARAVIANLKTQRRDVDEALLAFDFALGDDWKSAERVRRVLNTWKADQKPYTSAEVAQLINEIEAALTGTAAHVQTVAVLEAARSLLTVAAQCHGKHRSRDPERFACLDCRAEREVVKAARAYAAALAAAPAGGGHQDAP